MVEYKLEGDVLVIKASLSTGVDQDKDGSKSVEVGGIIELRLDGSEVVEELVKSTSLFDKVREKLGF